MLILGQKGANLDEKGTKMGGAGFFRTANLYFLKEDHKISFYTKNQQHSTTCSEDISQNVDFGPERGKFGPKRAQNGRNQIFPTILSLGYFINRPKMQFKYAKLRGSYDSFPRNWPKFQFLG